jgi:hypothetical protein
VTVTPLSGTLSAGQSQTVTVSLNPLGSQRQAATSGLTLQGCTTCTLTISPGGIVVTVDIVVGNTGAEIMGPAAPAARPALVGRLVD